MNSSPVLRVRRGVKIRISMALVMLTCAIFALGFTKAYAATFDPTRIISDENFRASACLSPQDIQSFLARYNSVLATASAPRHSDGSIAPVSQLIWEVSQEFEINPKVLLVTLQKEQSLIEATTATQTRLDWALGFGCPDGVAVENRDPAYKGLGNQIWWAARYLNRYCEDSTHWTYPWTVGKIKTVSSPVLNADNTITLTNIDLVPANLCTYKLYLYTPHIGGVAPYGDQNTLRLATFGGNGLFWKLYWKYFGDPNGNPSVVPVYRFYNVKTGTHFYTASEGERYTVIKKYPTIYQFEGIGYSINTANAANSVPLYRFYNVKTGTHFYTASEDEKNNVIAKWPKIFTLEGVAYYVSQNPDNATPVYRFYNKKTGTHFYTASEAERENVIAKYSATYTFEGIAYYIGY
ncbi:MAG: hypothetical protein AB2L09_03830 [Coriobacteriia bacterium]